MYKLGTHQDEINAHLPQPRIKQCFCLFLNLFKDSYLRFNVYSYVFYWILQLFSCSICAWRIPYACSLAAKEILVLYLMIRAKEKRRKKNKEKKRENYSYNRATWLSKEKRNIVEDNKKFSQKLNWWYEEKVWKMFSH